MNTIQTTSFCEPFIERLVDFLEENYIKKGKDLSRLAIVFGGKRPALFVKKELSRRLKTNFYPPRFFSIDEFITYILSKQGSFGNAWDLDHCYLLYALAKEHTPQLLKGRETFAQFLPWTREILSFIDQLDLEDVDDNRLKKIETNAQIGYSVPQDINNLLESIVTLRQAYHAKLKSLKVYSRGLQYSLASQYVEQVSFDEFDQIVFGNLFYLNRSEEKILQNLYARKKASFIFQGDERRWPILAQNARHLGTTLHEAQEVPEPKFQLNLHRGFDSHSQIGLLRDILQTIEHPDRTVIVLPNSDQIIPLLSEVTSLVKDFNISMGYPLKRSSLYSLFEFVFSAQLSKKNQSYYAKDYLKVIRHPFVKNLQWTTDPAVTRVMIHKIEEILTGKETSSISGELFIELEDIESCEELYMLTLEVLDRMGLKTNREQLLYTLEEIHELFFAAMERVTTFAGFARSLKKILDILIEKSFLRNYPLNINIAGKVYEICEEFARASFEKEHFPQEDLFKIFENKMSHEMMAFHGSPLKGLQILGLFETRSLNFENVIMLDVNEGVLPRLNIYEPLIPREVMVSLNLDRVEMEEEIQRYQFMRLISSAQKVHLIYQESKDKERSRFVEKLVWEAQKKHNSLQAAFAREGSFEVKVSPAKKSIRKTPEVVAFLRNMTYSASSINTYLRNPWEFYEKYVLGLKEEEDLLDEPEARHIGTFIHEVLEHSFRPLVNKPLKLDAAFEKRFQTIFDDHFEATFGRSMSSDAFLLKSVVWERLTRFLENERRNPERAVEEILYLESRFEDRIQLSVGEIKFKYIVDRVDKLKDGTIMIVDYKTGTIDQMPKAISQIATMLLSRESIRDQVKSFQIPLYFHYLNKKFSQQKINAALYNLRTLKVQKFMDEKMFSTREEINTAFLRALDYIIKEICDPAIEFREDIIDNKF